MTEHRLITGKPDPLNPIDRLILKQTGDESHRRAYFVLGGPAVYVEENIDTGVSEIWATWLDTIIAMEYEPERVDEGSVIRDLPRIDRTRQTTGDWSVLGEKLLRAYCTRRGSRACLGGARAPLSFETQPNGSSPRHTLDRHTTLLGRTMIRRTSIVASTVFAAALSLSACGGGDDKAATSAPATVASSVASATSSSPSMSSTSSSAPATSSTTTSTTTTTSVAPSSKAAATTTTAPKTTATAPKTTVNAAPVQMGGKCGTTASGYTIYADPNVRCDYAMRVAAQLHENPPSSVTAYSSGTKANVTSSCFEGSTANIVCTTPSGSLITASVRG